MLANIDVSWLAMDPTSCTWNPEDGEARKLQLPSTSMVVLSIRHCDVGIQQTTSLNLNQSLILLIPAVSCELRVLSSGR